MNQKHQYVLYNLIREKYLSLGNSISDKKEKEDLLELCEVLKFYDLKKRLHEGNIRI